MFRKLVLSLIALALMSGCGGGGKKVSITKANAKFTNGDYSTALENYIDLIPSQGVPAVVGAGWCSLRLNNSSQADSFFTTIAGSITPEGNAGWSFALWALNNPTTALAKANAVLAADANFSFSLDPRIDKDDIVWIQAACYLQMADYTNCLAKIKVLEPSYSYTLSGNNYTDSTTLLAKLQSLGAAS